MATLKELMGDLTRGDGRKFARKRWGPKEYFEPIFSDKDGDWFGLDSFGYQNSNCADDVHDWEPYIEPKAKKKVKLYRPIYLDTNRVSYVTHSKWDSNKSYFCDFYFQKVVGWQEMEVEVDE